jgi:uncharacterized protein YjiS (DUF1127 family)
MRAFFCLGTLVCMETDIQGSAAMSSIFDALGLGHSAARTHRLSSFFMGYWDAFQERRQRERLRAALSDLSDRELMDIGTTRGEIDYVASNRDIDPRGIRSAEWLRYLPTVDGQIGYL